MHRPARGKLVFSANNGLKASNRFEMWKKRLVFGKLKCGEVTHMEEGGGDSEIFGLSMGEAAAAPSLALSRGCETRGCEIKIEEEDVNRTAGHPQKYNLQKYIFRVNREVLGIKVSKCPSPCTCKNIWVAVLGQGFTFFSYKMVCLKIPAQYVP